MTSVDEQLEQVAAGLRAEQQATTQALLRVALAMPNRTLRAVAVDATRGSVLLVIHALTLRVPVERAAQAGELERIHRTGPTELTSGVMLDGGRVLLVFSGGEWLVPLVGEALISVTNTS